MDIAIIGDGNVGSALQQGLRRIGIEAPTTGKDPDKVRDLANKNDMLILAVPWTEHDNVVKQIGDVGGKVLVDVSNPMAEGGEFAEPQPSLAQQLQQKAPGANVVKAFNTIFAKNMGSATVQGQPLTLFLAADDEGAKRKVERLGQQMGYDVVDAGPLANARWLETLGFLNIKLGFGQGLGTDIGFRLVHPQARTPPTQAPQASR